ncbi:hypothetical protein ACJJTC_004636 [Scirpophaga incertulas]
MWRPGRWRTVCAAAAGAALVLWLWAARAGPARPPPGPAAAREPAPIPGRELPLIFIGGVPRSGTTLMRAMLDAHRDVRCGQETRVVPRILQMRQHWARSQKESVRLEQAGVSKAVLDNAIAAFCLQVIVHHGEPAPRLCNKDPLVLKMGTYVLELFPNAKFLFMVRDGRATVHSIISRKVTITGAARWGPARCLAVRYEALVLRPERTLRRVLAFLALPWDPAVPAPRALHQPAARRGALQVRVSLRPCVSVSLCLWRCAACSLPGAALGPPPCCTTSATSTSRTGVALSKYVCPCVPVSLCLWRCAACSPCLALPWDPAVLHHERYINQPARRGALQPHGVALSKYVCPCVPVSLCLCVSGAAPRARLPGAALGPRRAAPRALHQLAARRGALQVRVSLRPCVPVSLALRRVLAFLALPWDPAVLHHERYINQPHGVALSKYVCPCVPVSLCLCVSGAAPRARLPGAALGPRRAAPRALHQPAARRGALQVRVSLRPCVPVSLALRRGARLPGAALGTPPCCTTSATSTSRTAWRSPSTCVPASLCPLCLCVSGAAPACSPSWRCPGTPPCCTTSATSTSRTAWRSPSTCVPASLCPCVSGAAPRARLPGAALGPRRAAPRALHQPARTAWRSPSTCVPASLCLCVSVTLALRRVLALPGAPWDPAVLHHERYINQPHGVALSKYVCPCVPVSLCLWRCAACSPSWRCPGTTAVLHHERYINQPARRGALQVRVVPASLCPLCLWRCAACSPSWRCPGTPPCCTTSATSTSRTAWRSPSTCAPASLCLCVSVSLALRRGARLLALPLGPRRAAPRALHQPAARRGALQVRVSLRPVVPVSLALRRVLAFLALPWDPAVLHHERYINQPHGVALSNVERSSDQVVRPVNLDALDKWVGHVPADVRADMADVAPMLSVLGYDPWANPPPYDALPAHPP